MPDFEELTITLPDGYDAYARYWPVEQAKAAVLYLHGIQSHCGWYEQSAGRLQRAGLAVLQPDRRGSGRNPQGRGHAESHDQLIDDAVCCGEHLLSATKLGQFHLIGISWGGRLACAVTVAKRDLVASLSLVCPGLFPRVDVSNAEKFKIGLSMLGNRDRLFDIPLSDAQLFTSQPKWIEFLRNDPLTLHQVTASFFLATRRMDSAIRDLPDGPAIALHVCLAEDDEIIESAKTAEYVRSLNWPRTQITHYPNVKHTLEFESVCEDYFDDLVSWIRSNL